MHVDIKTAGKLSSITRYNIVARGFWRKDEMTHVVDIPTAFHLHDGCHDKVNLVCIYSFIRFLYIDGNYEEEAVP